MTDLSERIAALSPEKRELLLRRLGEQRDRSADGSRTSIQRQHRTSNVLTPSFAQERLWFLDRLESQTATYNLATAVRLLGTLDADALAQSVREIQRRHEVLRTSLQMRDGRPVQVVYKKAKLKLELVDLSGLDDDMRDSEMRRLTRGEAQRPFDLSAVPLIRTKLLRLGPTDHVFLLTIHHIVSDAWSVGVVFAELMQLYTAFSEGKPSPLPQLPIQYADYAVWQRERLQGDLLERQLDYWKLQLDHAPVLLDLPTDRPRPAVQTYAGSTESLVLPDTLSEPLKSLATQEGATLFMVLLAAFQALMMRYTCQEDVVVGTPVAGRTRSELEGLVGLFVNTLALRTDLSGNPTFRQLLGRARDVCLDAYAHQDVPFEKLVEELQPQRNRSHSPLFQVMLALQNVPLSNIALPGITLSTLGTGGETAKFDATLYMMEIEAGLAGVLEYNTALFDKETARRLLGHWQTLLEAIVENPDERVWDLPLLLAAERQQLVVEWNATAVAYPDNVCVHELVEAQVERTPEAVAVVFEDQKVTYRELDCRANQLAHHLQRCGVGPDVLVGLFIERSVELVIAIYAVLKAGGAYVPLDPEYPRDRVAFMVHDTELPVIVSQASLLRRLPDTRARVVCLDGDASVLAAASTRKPRVAVGVDHLAYVIYTSGSTGRPKGVMNAHRGLANRLCWMQDAFQLTPDDRVLQKTPFSFDVSVWEFFWPLMTGARLVVARPGGHRDAAYLIELIRTRHITTIHFVPSMLRVFLEHDAVGRCEALRRVVCSGEALPSELQQRFFTRLGAELHNLYGPTEAAIDVTAWACSQEHEGVVPIGRPVANTQVYVLDRKGQPVPVGVPGELHIGGVQVARGYWRRPDLTRERFIPDPFCGNGGCLYKTGDLARWRPDGNLEFLGRLDHQVKIRGHRIELGEIEEVLHEHDGVREAVVLAREDEPGDPRLVAYYVAEVADDAPAAGDLRSHLRDKLPDYMVPASFIALNLLPLMPNGKVDRGKLPAPGPSVRDVGGEFVAARNDLERALTAMWEEVLGKRPVGVTDDFFELGGHSLLAVRLFSRIEDRFGRYIPLDVLFEAPTISALAEHLRRGGASESVSSVVMIQPNGSRLPFFVVPPSASPGLVFAKLAQALGNDQPIYGLTPQALDGGKPRRKWFQEIASHYIREMRRIQPDGPYLLGGRCFGGFVVYEMAQQLVKQGDEVALLVLMDVGPPLTRSIQFYRQRLRVDARMKYINFRRYWRKRLPPIEYAVIPYHMIHFDVVPSRRRHKASQDKLVWDANLRAAANYVTRRYPGRIALLQSSSHDDEFVKQEWQKLAGGGIDYDVVEGHHKEVLREPLVQVTAAKLNHRLESVKPS